MIYVKLRGCVHIYGTMVINNLLIRPCLLGGGIAGVPLNSNDCYRLLISSDCYIACYIRDHIVHIAKDFDWV